MSTDQTASAMKSILEQPVDETEFKHYAIAYSSAKPTGFMNYYFWLEACAWLYGVALVYLVCSGVMPQFYHLKLPLWFAPQFMFIISFVSVIFFVGPPPYNLKQLQRLRHKVHLVYAFVMGLAAVATNVSFIVIYTIYANSDACESDPTSLCQTNSTAVFTFIRFVVGFLITLDILSVLTVVFSFTRKK